MTARRDTRDSSQFPSRGAWLSSLFNLFWRFRALNACLFTLTRGILVVDVQKQPKNSNNKGIIQPNQQVVQIASSLCHIRAAALLVATKHSPKYHTALTVKKNENKLKKNSVEVRGK